MKINIKRFSKDKSFENKVYQYDIKEDNLLKALYEIKINIDSGLRRKSPFSVTETY